MALLQDGPNFLDGANFKTASLDDTELEWLDAMHAVQKGREGGGILLGGEMGKYNQI